MKLSNVFKVLLVFAVSGCASQDFTGNRPEQPDIKTSVSVDKNFDDTWNTIVGNLSKSFFVINNIEKESGIINVSFAADDASRFIDCGTSTITTNDQSKTVELASDFTAPYVYQKGVYKFVGESKWDGSLDGRMNIYVEEKSPRTTNLSVSARYVFSAKERIYDNQGRQGKILNYDTTFQTNGSGEFENIKCVSKGVLENRVLEMASE